MPKPPLTTGLDPKEYHVLIGETRHISGAEHVQRCTAADSNRDVRGHEAPADCSVASGEREDGGRCRWSSTDSCS